MNECDMNNWYKARSDKLQQEKHRCDNKLASLSGCVRTEHTCWGGGCRVLHIVLKEI